MAGGDDTLSISTALTRGFIEQRAAPFHQAFGVNSHFNTTMSQYQPKEVADLEETLRQYQKLVPDQLDFEFNLLDCSWNDVLRERDRAQAAVSESNDRGKGFHRRIWRTAGSMGGALEPGLAAIPDNLCVLHGGLAVVFSLARHRAQTRQKILRAFEDLPTVIVMASGKAENIPRDRAGSERLHAMIADLQQTLLRVLPVLIDRLNPGTFLGKALSPLRGYDVDDLLKAVRSSSDKVRACAEQIMDNIIVTNDKATKDIHTITHQTDQKVVELRRKVDEVLDQQKSFQSTLDAISGKNHLFSFIMEMLKNPEQAEEVRSPKPSPPVYQPATPVTPSQLLNMMNVQHLEALDHEHRIVRRGSNALSSDATSHAATMLQTAPVQQLLHAPKSGVVLVNGCTDRSQNNKISSMTHLSATLTQALRRASEPNRNIVLAFFCGHHASSHDDLTGPQGLMRSLVAHLVLSLVQRDHISDSAPIWFSAFQGQNLQDRPLEDLSFGDICELFYHLVELVPPGITVYCVIDGISEYERDDWRDNYGTMMTCFGNLVAANPGVAAIFKLLMTSPTQSRWLQDLLEPHQQVWLRNSRNRSTSNAAAYLRSTLG